MKLVLKGTKRLCGRNRQHRIREMAVVCEGRQKAGGWLGYTP